MVIVFLMNKEIAGGMVCFFHQKKHSYLILRPKIPIWVYFGGPWNEKCWYILCPFGIIYGQLV
jgi:hypothetical protein